MASHGPVIMPSNDPFGDHSIIVCIFTRWNSVSCHLIAVLHPKYHVQAMTVAGVDTCCTSSKVSCTSHDCCWCRHLSSFGLKIMDDHMGFWVFSRSLWPANQNQVLVLESAPGWLGNLCSCCYAQILCRVFCPLQVELFQLWNCNVGESACLVAESL